ncbi:MAG TPA: tetratricopeptide repeat protein [Burkholderiaceae bacterium]|nr:tetratricopeptide repeat protein [Burkholderiaceae bacterium]
MSCGVPAGGRDRPDGPGASAAPRWPHRLAAALLVLAAGVWQPAPADAQQSDPRAANTALTQANRLFREGKPDDALKALDIALKESPRDPQLRFLYGVILNDRGRANDALEVFRQLTQDFPELPEPYNNLAVLYASRGDLDQARSALESAVRALPSYSLAYENLGDVYLRMAVRSYERASRPAGSAAVNEAARSKLAMARELMDKVVPPAAAPATSPVTTPAPQSGSPATAAPR